MVVDLTVATQGLQLQQDASPPLDAPEICAQDLRKAIETGEIVVLYQPQFSSATGTVAGAEALSRWQHPSYGMIGGKELFEIAEQTGLVQFLSQHIISRALDTASSWPNNVALSLNLTPQELCEPGYAAGLIRLAMSAGSVKELLTVEITEQTLLSRLDIATGELRLLRSAGMKVALDDFGAGFCNFSYLKRLPLDVIKLDRSMIDGVVKDQRDLAVLRAIIALAKALDLSIVAEGIETESLRDAIKDEGCDYWQGYLGGRPMTNDELLSLVGS